jgi:hypothetical protein
VRDHARRKAVLFGVLVLTTLALGWILFMSHSSGPRAAHPPRAPKPDAALLPNSVPTALGPEQTAPVDEKGSAPEGQVEVTLAPGKQPGPACRADDDCTGAHSPDCVRARCIDRHCIYDDSSCGCATNEACDDSDPCTRDLCFSRTRKCIHIEEGCDKKAAP